jgi:hypothetical protein
MKERMKRIHILAVAALVCLAAVLALPVAALPNAAEKAAIDPGLKDELWTIHTQHRLDRFDSNVEAARKAVAALEKSGYETSGLSATVDAISGHRDALSAALEARDRQELRSINKELLSLWKEFRQEMKLLLRGE